ncbi:MAG: redox-regulated ATPase YchF [archaeon GBS-70-058]|nr:redox-regulated ATPase YchF [Candidatus Culexarchaeum nevadense]
MIKVGLIGKTNTGKTTFFNAATLLSEEVSTYPFTTKKPNIGTATVQTVCVCKEFKVKDNPQNSKCIEGWRYIPIELIDLPGLIKGAHLGRGLGDQFLSVAMQSDALLHIVDASGSIDAEGRICQPGIGNPIADYYEVEYELVEWFKKVIESNKDRVEREYAKRQSMVEALYQIFSGMKVTRGMIYLSLEKTGLLEKKIDSWTEEDYNNFSMELRTISKPTLIVANKMDLGIAEENYKRMIEEFGQHLVVPCSAEAELALRRAEQQGLVKYIPGMENFEILDESKLNPRQRWALGYIKHMVMDKLLRTGVQLALNIAVFKLLRMNVVYPVEDPEKLTDKKGNVLPDAFLMPNNATLLDLAKEIHSDLARGLLYGIDVRTGIRLPKDYILRDRDVITLISTTKRR